jgi:hypothetical protein
MSGLSPEPLRETHGEVPAWAAADRKPVRSTRSILLMPDEPLIFKNAPQLLCGPSLSTESSYAVTHPENNVSPCLPPAPAGS